MPSAEPEPISNSGILNLVKAVSETICLAVVPNLLTLNATLSEE